MTSLFLSHASADAAAARATAERLKSWGYASLFLDIDPDTGLRAGSKWETQLYRHLKLSRALIALVSESFVASHWCFAEVAQARAMGKPVFPLKIGPCTNPSLLADVQIVDLTQNESEGWERLRREIQAVVGDDLPFHADTPYPGLSSFDAGDAGVFFGREEEQGALVETLERMRRRGEPRLALVLGASGSGKSSLVRAGVLPRLDPQRWLIVPPWRPGGAPQHAFARALAEAFGTDGPGWRALADALEKRPWADVANDLREARHARDAAVLVVVDQLEELFALGTRDKNNAAAFCARLRREVEAPGSPLFVLGTLRSDFLGTFQLAPELRGLPFEDIPLGPLPRERLARVIAGPAARVGLELEEGLTERLVQDTGSGDALPLLAFTLRQLWDRRRDDRLTVDAYERELGNIEGAVAAIAAGIASAEPSAETAALRSAFLRMVRLDDEGRFARQPAPWDAFPEAAWPLLERFVNEHLLVSHTVDGARQVEVAHEALFRAWKPLALWLDEERGFLQFRRRLGRAREEWALVNQAEDQLLRGSALAEAERWLEQRSKDLDDAQRAFIASSTASRMRAESAARRRRQRLMTVLAAGLVVAVGLSSVAFWLWRQAEEQRRLALAGQLATLSDSRSIESTDDRVYSLLFATESLRSAWTPEGYAAWVAAMRELGPGPVQRTHLAEKTTGLAASPDSRWVAVAEGANVVRILALDPARLGAEVRRLDVPSGGVSPRGRTLGFSPDGRWLAAARDRTLHVWSTATWELVKSIDGYGATSDFAFSPDGELLVAAQTELLFGPVDTRTWTLPDEDPRPNRGGEYSLAVTFLDNRHFAVGKSGSMEFWSAELAPVRRTLDRTLNVAPPTAIHRLAFAADGVGLAWADECCPSLFTVPATDGPLTLLENRVCADTPRSSRHVDFLLEGDVPGTQLACADTDGHLWLRTLDILDHATQRLPARDATKVVLSSDGRWVIAAGNDLEIWEDLAFDNRQTPQVAEINADNALAWSPDGRWLAADSGGQPKIYDAQTLQPVPIAETGSEESEEIELAFSRTGRLVMRQGSSVFVFAAGDTGWRVVTRVRPGYGASVALSPDGSWLETRTPAQTTDRSGELIRPSRSHIWNVANGADVAWRTHEESDIAAFLERNSRFTREMLKVRWEQPRAEQQDPSAETAPLGEGGQIDLLDRMSVWEPIEFEPPASSPNGRWTIDGATLIDPVTKRGVPLAEAPDDSWVHAWSPVLDDGVERVIVANADGYAVVWPLGPVSVLMSAACARLPRDLTAEEWPLAGPLPVTCPRAED